MCDVMVFCLNNSLHKSILVGIIYPLTDLLEFDADHGSSVTRYNTDFVRFSTGGSAVSLVPEFVIGGADACVCFVTPCLTAVIFRLYNIMEACPCSSDG